MRLVIVGVGYVGKALLEHLNAHHHLIATTTKPERIDELTPLVQEVILLEPGDSASYKRIIESSDGMLVLVAPKGKATYEDTYLKTAEIIRESLNGRQKPYYLLYTSSTSVYEGSTSEWVDEETELNPISLNSQILCKTEQIFLSLPFDVCILRLGGIYGPGRELIDRARRLSGKVLPGTGDEPTNNIHLDAIIAAIVASVDERRTGVYNIVNNDHPSRNELYSSLCQSLSLPPPLWDASQPNAKGYKVSTRK